METNKFHLMSTNTFIPIILYVSGIKFHIKSLKMVRVIRKQNYFKELWLIGNTEFMK